MAEASYNSSGRMTSMRIKADKSEDELADSAAKDRATDTTRLKAKSEAGFPSRKDYDSDSAYYKAIGEYRAKKQADPDVAGQKKALSRMGAR